jgi:hypothetical protein
MNSNIRFSALFLAAALMFAPPAAAAVLTATTPGELKAALVAAHAGDTISAGGGDYSAGLKLASFKYPAPGVTVDFAGAPVGLCTCSDLAGITFKAPRILNRWVMYRLQGVTFDGSTGAGYLIQQSADVALLNVKAAYGNPVSFVAVNGLKIYNSAFRDFGNNGVSIYDSNDVDLQRVSVLNSAIAGTSGHADGIQFATQGGRPMKNISLTDVTIAASSQGLFMGDGAPGYYNVRLTRVFIASDYPNGFMIQNAHALVIEDMELRRLPAGLYGPSAKCKACDPANVTLIGRTPKLAYIP